MSNCPICSSSTTSSPVICRSGTTSFLKYCSICDFSFFSYDPTSSLSAGNLESTRLAAAGLSIPCLDQDFTNTLAQAHFYCDTYSLSTQPSLNILDYGCSTGAFLSVASSYGHTPYGVELNKQKCEYVNKNLSISCCQYLSQLPDTLFFDRIFLFYSLEYIPDFKSILLDLYLRLKPSGTLVIHTPNLNDILLKCWELDDFRRFFYDDHSVNYFSIKSIQNLLSSLNFSNFSLVTVQGYSIFNHVNWLFHGQPYSSPFVGSDILSQSLNDKLSLMNSSNPVRPFIQSLVELDHRYKELFSSQYMGNNIILSLSKPS